jgi:hypothetical protein
MGFLALLAPLVCNAGNIVNPGMREGWYENLDTTQAYCIA